MSDTSCFAAFSPGEVTLTGGVHEERHRHNVDYLLSLRDANLLQNHYIEAGINVYPNLFGTWEGKPGSRGESLHWGWETPGSALRGQFLGHWMSAAAHEVANTGNPMVRVRLHAVLQELIRCQREHGGEWIFSIPPLYFDHLAQGRPNGVPQYVVHKTLMGLVDAYRYAGEAEALEAAISASRWIRRWSGGFDQVTWDAILDVETGGMLEVWADLYDITHDDMFAELLDRYWHGHLFDPLLSGEDVLTNRHANTTIPEAIGAARAYEVTGQQRWKDVVERYWRCAVDDRGTFATGGCNSGEIWCPPFAFAARRGDKNQELCTVYNMMRLAEILFRWTGDTRFMDYYELNSINGVLAQTHPSTGMPAYYLPLQAGLHKLWGSPTYDFWCCHGSVVQANELHQEGVYYRSLNPKDSALTIVRYLDTTLHTTVDGAAVQVAMLVGDPQGGDALHNAADAGDLHRPRALRVRIDVDMASQVFHELRLRVPSWSQGSPHVSVNGTCIGDRCTMSDGFLHVPVRAGHSAIDLEIGMALHAVPIPDEQTTVAFMDGPVVLAGICDEERTFYGDPSRPDTLMAPDNERQWGTWQGGYRTVRQPLGSVRMKPLFDIADEAYTVYFPVRPDMPGAAVRN
jgi:DUF1680 family protein